MQNQKSNLLTVQEAAAELGLAAITIRVWLAQRRMGHVKLGRSVRIPASEVSKIIEKGFVPAERQA